MATDSLTNVRPVHAQCAQARCGRFEDKEPSWFVGKHVKLGIPIDESENPSKEWLWVEVTGIDDDGNCTGKIANDPILLEVPIGTEVTFDSPEVAEVLDSDGREIQPDE